MAGSGLFGTVLFLLFSAFASAAPVQTEEWHLNKHSDGIEVYGRPKAGSMREDIKSVVVIDLPFSRLEAVLRDVEASSRWMHLLQDVKVFTKPGSSEMLYYFHWDVPWPFEDRDAVCAREEIHNEQTGLLAFRYTPQPDAYPQQKRRVRLRTFECLWQLEPLGETRVRVTNQLTLTSEGLLPASFVNWINTKISLKTMQSLREFASRQAG